MQSKEYKKDSEKSQKKLKSNPEISTESHKLLRKVQSSPETSPVIIKPLDQRIKEAQRLKILETVKSIGSKELHKFFNNSKSFLNRSKSNRLNLFSFKKKATNIMVATK